MPDIFRPEDVVNLLQNLRIVVIGDSIVRNIYKDLVWISKHRDLIPDKKLALKGSQIPDFEGDYLVPGTGKLETGRNYKEEREYQGKVDVTYFFVSRCFSVELENFLRDYHRRRGAPHIILVLSAIWDISRWGPYGFSKYEGNCEKLLMLVNRLFPDTTQLIWLLCPPVSEDVSGPFVVEGIEKRLNNLRFRLLEGNRMVAETVAAYGHDVIDLHHLLFFQTHTRMHDGIHWHSPAVRLQTNAVLEHISRSRGVELPNRFSGEQEIFSRKIVRAAELEHGEIVRDRDTKQELDTDCDDRGPTQTTRPVAIPGAAWVTNHSGSAGPYSDSGYNTDTLARGSAVDSNMRYQTSSINTWSRSPSNRIILEKEDSEPEIIMERSVVRSMSRSRDSKRRRRRRRRSRSRSRLARRRSRSRTQKGDGRRRSRSRSVREKSRSRSRSGRFGRTVRNREEKSRSVSHRSDRRRSRSRDSWTYRPAGPGTSTSWTYRPAGPGTSTSYAYSGPQYPPSDQWNWDESGRRLAPPRYDNWHHRDLSHEQNYNTGYCGYQYDNFNQ